SVKPSINPIGNKPGFEPTNSFTLTAIVCDSITGLSNIGAAEWSYGASAASAGTGNAMTAVDGNFNELYEEVTVAIVVDGTWPTGDVKIWVRGRDDSPSKSPNNWGSALSTTVTILNTATYTGIKLVSFTALTGDGLITLKWRTADDNDNAYFLIERSNSKYGTFKEVGKVLSDGRASEYSYTDENVFGGEQYYYRLVDVSTSGAKVTHPIITVLANGKPKPTTYMISQNYPNPFNGRTMIDYAIPMRAEVSLSIYDVTGKLIKTLVKEKQDVNYYRVVWDGKDNRGSLVSAGVYFYKMTSGSFDKSMKMMYLK
ncbi:T9SS type A sorting domain-containing protein, partial [candidate division WOR-3 bacterium]|nr:T9SS type A sorting domain-containing protein [candidate division WOR-3 bacterium]